MRNTALLFSLCLVAACEIDSAAPGVGRGAATVSGGLVIAQIYGGGGNTGATFANDFVVLFNRGAVAQSTAGLRLSYASDTGNFATTGSTIFDLPTVSIASGAYYLIKLASGGGIGAALANVDATGTANLSASAGKVALAPITGGVGGCGAAATACDPANWIDLVGYGSSASQAESGSKAGAMSNTTMLQRAGAGCIDTGSNSADLTVVTAVAPANGMTATQGCTPPDLSGADLTQPPDLTVVPDLSGQDLATAPPPDLYGYSLLINEVKWNPSGSDNGQEFVELLGTGTIPTNTWLLSVDGDSGVAGRINFAHNLSGVAMGSNGLLLLKGAATTFAGVAAGTTVVDDTALNGTPLQNGTENVLLVWSPTPLVIMSGTTNFSSLTSAVVLDAISAMDSGGTIYGATAIPTCMTPSANPVDAASRIPGNTTPKSVAAWYAGQTVGAPTDPFLDDTSVCSSGPATWSLSPGRANDDPQQPAPDLGPSLDLAQPDLAHGDMNHGSGDMSHGGGDLAMSGDDLSVPVGAADMAKSGTGGRDGGGCAVGGGAASGLWLGIAMLMIALWQRRQIVAG